VQAPGSLIDARTVEHSESQRYRWCENKARYKVARAVARHVTGLPQFQDRRATSPYKTVDLRDITSQNDGLGAQVEGDGSRSVRRSVSMRACAHKMGESASRAVA